ncbi:MAG: TolC family protein [Melioribacteraceae bacterium]|nr:TolC family protein [Melioribacteraceae bacterium]
MKKGFNQIMGVLLLLLLAVSINAQSESKKKLSLKEALDMAKEKNFEIKLAQTDVDRMQADKNSSLAVFLPQVTLSETFIRTNDPLNSFGFKLKQEIVTAMDFNPMLLNDPAIINNYTTKLEVKQPLLNFDGFYGRSAASNAVDAMEYKLKRTKEFIEFQVKVSYYQVLLAKRSLKVVDKALKAAINGRNTAKDYFDKGYMNKADYLMAEVYVSSMESNKLEALNGYFTASNNLKFLLDIKGEETIEPTDELTKPSVSEYDYSFEEINEVRTDMMAMKHRIAALESASTMNYLKFVPRLNAFGSYEYNDKDLGGTGGDSWMVGLNLQWNVFNGFQNIAGIQKSQAELDNARVSFNKAKSQNRVEVESAIGDLETAKKKLVLASKALEQSNESLRIMRDRFEKGLEKTADLLRVEAENSNSNLNYLKTLFFYNVSVYKTELMLGKKITL